MVTFERPRAQRKDSPSFLHASLLHIFPDSPINVRNPLATDRPNFDHPHIVLAKELRHSVEILRNLVGNNADSLLRHRSIYPPLTL
jgi:hypothetical protein